MIHISSKQIRAARGLLNWSQKILAHHAGLSINSLNNIERDVGSPRMDSMLSIQYALEKEGVEFLEKDGVRLAGELLKIKKSKATTRSSTCSMTIASGHSPMATANC